jgi:ubiquitin-protein ligase
MATALTRLASEHIDLFRDIPALRRRIPHPNGQPFDGTIYQNYILDIYRTQDNPEDNVWDIVILGPKNTPYEGGKFLVRFNAGNFYPFRLPPDPVEFITPIYHLNIGTGRVPTSSDHHDQLVKFPHFLLAEDWSPAYMVFHVSFVIFIVRGSINFPFCF